MKEISGGRGNKHLKRRECIILFIFNSKLNQRNRRRTPNPDPPRGNRSSTIAMNPQGTEVFSHIERTQYPYVTGTSVIGIKYKDGVRKNTPPKLAGVLMASEIELIEERLKSFLGQLLAEYGILDRLVYKNKNQHRRSSYFQFLQKVRRDMKLLQSAHLEDLLESCFVVVSGRKAKQKAYLLESLKKGNCDSGNYNFMDRLLGSARLLSQMVEPILKAATEISKLLARLFFMGLSLATLAMLARIRLLVQQILLDIVFLYNEVSCIAQKKQSIKINQDGLEVFREYYPKMEEVITLECVWEIDTFVLVEKAHKISPKLPEELLDEAEAPKKPVFLYRTFEAFLGESELSLNKDSDSNPDNTKLEDAFPGPVNTLDISEEPFSKKPCSGDSIVGSSSLSKPRVAFISVKKPVANTPPATISTAPLWMNGEENQSNIKDDEADPFFNLLSGGTTNGSILGVSVPIHF